MVSAYTVKTPATEYPVSLIDMKTWLRIDFSTDDALISALIKAATNQGEHYCNRAFVTRSIEAKFSGISGRGQYPFIDIARAPVFALTSAEYYLNSVLTAIPADDYEFQPNNEFARILFYNTPSADDVAYPFIINFDAGYGAEIDVPEDIKTAIKEHVSFLYENRGDVQAIGGERMPATSGMIYRTGYRIIATF